MTTHPRTDARMTRTPAGRLFLALAGTPLDTRPDAELLDRFARYGERPALEAVVRRHAGLVRGVCRRHLGNSPDADDAFQATFLVLLRHVGRGRPPAKVGPWLYSVAVRTSARLRSRRQFAPLPEVAAPEVPATDWLPLLDRELAALPAEYRDALVLCELQGKSRKDGARLLDIAEGTLSRGRELLRRRLLKHGTLLPAAGLGLVAEAASAETITAAVGLADGAVPATVAAAVPPAGWGLWKLLTAGMAACVVGGLATVPGGDTPKADEPAKPAAVAATPDKMTPPASDRDALQGLWVFQEYLLTDSGRQGAGGDLYRFPRPERLVVHNDRAWFLGFDRLLSDTFTLDPTRRPKWIDLRPRPLDRVLQWPDPLKGVYTLAGDRLTLALGTRRPADPGPAENGGPAVPVAYHRGPAPDHVTAAAVGPLLGRWELVRSRDNFAGGRVRETTLGWLEVTPYALFWRYDAGLAGAKRFDDPTDTATAKPMMATFALDPAKSHPWIDLQLLTTAENGDPGKRYGVYALAGDTLRLVLGRDRTFRPLDFEVTPDPTPPGKPLKGPDLQTECFEFKRAAP